MKPVLKEKPEGRPFAFTVLLLVVLCLVPSGWASRHDSGEPYQDAVLVDFTTVSTGSSCQSSGDVDAKVDDAGNVSGHTSGNTDCRDNLTRHYTIAVKGHSYILAPNPFDTTGKKIGAIASLGWSGVFTKQSVLASQLPGAHILVRSEAKGIRVKVGNRVSLYRIVGVR